MPPPQPVLLLALLVAVTAWQFNNPFQDQQQLTYVNQQVQFFDQILDHYTYLSPKFWKQRYYINNAHFTDPNGPVLLYICG
jgi:hypothetical protein